MKSKYNLHEIEKQTIITCLKEFPFNDLNSISKKLGISINTLRRKIKDNDILKDVKRPELRGRKIIMNKMNIKDSEIYATAS